MESDDAESITQATESLMSVVQELGAAAYQQEAPEAAPDTGQDESEPESGEEDGEDVVEGEFRNEEPPPNEN
jgi:hypothetical protein